MTARKRRRLQMVALCGCLMFLPSPHISADITRVEFSGVLQSITTYANPGNSDLQPYFNVGDIVLGYLIYQTIADLSFENQYGAEYTHSLQFISITVGSYTATSEPTSNPQEHKVRVSDNSPSGGVLRDAVYFSGRGGFSEGIAGLDLFNLQFAVGSYDLNALQSTQLPSADTLNTLGDIYQGNVNFIAFVGGGALRYDMYNFHASVVPEPSTCSLILLSMSLAWWCRYRLKEYR